MNNKSHIMKKIVLTISIILGSNLSQAQIQLDTTDLFEGSLSKILKDCPRPKVYGGTGYLDHNYSVGRLKDIFSDSGESFREIFGQMPEEFPGIVYANDMSVPYIKLDDYYSKNIKGHSYDSLRYSVQNPKYDTRDGRLVLIEREGIDCYDSEGKGVRFIEITRYNGEIIGVLDSAEELALYKK